MKNESDYEKYGILHKNISYDEKVKTFESNVTSRLISMKIKSLTKEEHEDAYELLKNENVLVPNLPIFRYNGRVMSIPSDLKNENFDDGKYLILSASEIKKYLDSGYLVFLYCISDNIHNISENNSELKYDTIVITDNINDNLTEKDRYLDNVSNRWNKIGMLDEFPEEKKENLAELYEFTLNELLKYGEDELDNNIGTVIFPIIYRVYKEVDISKLDIIDLINSLNKNLTDLYKNCKECEGIRNANIDGIIVSKYTDLVINILKNKKGEN